MRNNSQKQTPPLNSPNESSKPGRLYLRTKRWLVSLLSLGLILALLGGSIVIFVYRSVQKDLPDVAELRRIELQVPLRVYSADDSLIAVYGSKRRLPLAIAEIPQTVQQAFLAAEDDRFFEHPGVDYQGLLRAFIELVRTGEKRQGGSTITMQVARNFFLDRDKTFIRKFKEIVLALRIERELSKAEILELYLNKIYLGQRAYGIGAAAQVYYGKSLAELSIAEIAMIAGLPKAPSSYNPISYPERAKERRNYVLRRLLTLQQIDTDTYTKAIAAPLTAQRHQPNIKLDAPFIAEMVRAEMVQRFGEEHAYTGGFVVYTTVQDRLQNAARQAVRENLLAYDRRHGWRGSEQRLPADQIADKAAQQEALAGFGKVGGLTPGLVITVAANEATVRIPDATLVTLSQPDIAWARRKIDVDHLGPTPAAVSDVLAQGDIVRLRFDTAEQRWQLAQIPEVNGALVALSPDNGAILALIGGFDFFASKFNRVTQAHRQPGSNFKPFIYSAALAKGFTPASIINDAPLVFENQAVGTDWRPENYSSKFFGPTRMRVALINSRNLVSIRLLRATGIEFTLDHVQHFGFDAATLPHDLTLSLGSATLPPLAMVRGYAVLANGGHLVTPYLIERILDDNTEVYVADPGVVCSSCTENPADPTRYLNGRSKAPRTVAADNVYQVVSMLQDVIRQGTGRRALQLGRRDLAGKTGTTNQQRDAWFSGFNRDVVATTWVGFDKLAPLGHYETGARAALPAWVEFMRVALADRPEHSLTPPPGMITVRVDPNTGLRAAASNPNAIFETFRADHVPPWETSLPTAGQAASHAEIPEQLF